MELSAEPTTAWRGWQYVKNIQLKCTVVTFRVVIWVTHFHQRKWYAAIINIWKSFAKCLADKTRTLLKYRISWLHSCLNVEFKQIFSNASQFWCSLSYQSMLHTYGIFYKDYKTFHFFYWDFMDVNSHGYFSNEFQKKQNPSNVEYWWDFFLMS